MKLKKKLRDLNPIEYDKYKKKNCAITCDKCIFGNVPCQTFITNCWIYHKELYSDKFLDQEIEVLE